MTFSLHSVAQINVVSDWRQNIKTSLNSINKANAITVDRQNNCYVLGTTWFTDSTKDILLVKYNPSGEEEWRRTYDNPSHGDDIPDQMCLDKEGNIWICGMAKPTPQNGDFLVVKFTPDGIPVASYTYDDKDHLYDEATCIVADRAGNIYCAGYSTTSDSGMNILVTKIHADGYLLWKKSYATSQMDIANNIYADDSCNVYMAGNSNSALHASDMIIQKYDSTGKKKWQQIYDGVLSKRDAAQFLSVDDSMNIYISGFINHINNRADIPLLKMNRNGVLLQEMMYNGHISDCGATSLRAERNRVFVTGLCNDYNISSITNFLIVYDKSGKEQTVIRTPDDLTFMGCENYMDIPLIVGAKTVHPESTLVPFIAQYDSSKLTWTYADSTVDGLSHIIAYKIDNNSIYFLGDDTGDATGTISVFKYSLNEEAEKKKKPVKRIK